MKALKGNPFFIMLALGLAFFGWIRGSFFSTPKPQFTIVHWPGDGSKPVYYEVADSSKISYFGSCIQFESIQEEKESICNNYKIVEGRKENAQGGKWKPKLTPALGDSVGEDEMLQELMQKNQAEALPADKY